jgi:hypothetical protein
MAAAELQMDPAQSHVLDRIEDCATGESKVRVERVMEAIGRRSFGPLLMSAGLLGMTPVSAMPGAPSVIAVTVVLISGQLMIGREGFWLPRFLLRAQLPSHRLASAVKVARKPAAFVDRLVKPRLQVLTRPMADRAVAGACLLLAMMTPPLELLPFVAFFPSTAIATFGLGLTARDGVLILIGLLVSVAVLGFAGFQLLS